MKQIAADTVQGAHQSRRASPCQTKSDPRSSAAWCGLQSSEVCNTVRGSNDVGHPTVSPSWWEQPHWVPCLAREGKGLWEGEEPADGLIDLHLNVCWWPSPFFFKAHLITKPDQSQGCGKGLVSRTTNTLNKYYHLLYHVPKAAVGLRQIWIQAQVSTIMIFKDKKKIFTVLSDTNAASVIVMAKDFLKLVGFCCCCGFFIVW